jgi:hypothetical protein
MEMGQPHERLRRARLKRRLAVAVVALVQARKARAEVERKA